MFARIIFLFLSLWSFTNAFTIKRPSTDLAPLSLSLIKEDIQNANPHIRRLLHNNRAWVKRMNEKNPMFFTKLGQGQSPKYLYFGCSDSRVPANEILGLGAGEVFVHRNIGNQIPGNDLNVLSVLEYAVDHLGVTDIIVVGHYACGAVKAATSRQDLGTLENWLRLIRDVYRLHKDQLDKINDPNVKHQMLVQYNVIEQCVNVYKTGVVQRKRAQIREKLYGAVSTPTSGSTKKEVVTTGKTVSSSSSSSSPSNVAQNTLRRKFGIAGRINRPNSPAAAKVQVPEPEQEPAVRQTIVRKPSNNLRKKYGIAARIRPSASSPAFLAEPTEEEVYPRIHGMVFDPSDGILRRLEIDFDDHTDSLDYIYGLYPN
jgi:carbonic anhydrase